MKRKTMVVIGLCLVAVVGGGWTALSLAQRRPPPPVPSTWEPSDPDLGRKAYMMCQGCHGLDGRGVPGYAPPLAGSRWLSGDPRAAILLVLHGYDATSEPGSAYYSSRMLGHGHQLADHEVAALLQWLRQRWGDGSTSIEPATVNDLRRRFARRSSPWSPAELRTLFPAP